MVGYYGVLSIYCVVSIISDRVIVFLVRVKLIECVSGIGNIVVEIM